MLNFYLMMFANAGPFTLNIASSVINPNIPALASSSGWNGFSPLIVNVTAPLVNTMNFLSSWSFPGGLTLNISANTRVGGVRNGGHAITTAIPIRIENLGIISGGGGSAGQGETIRKNYNGNVIEGVGGNGGAGEGFASAGDLTVVARATGQSGGNETYSGAVFGGDSRPSVTGGKGGNGGTWGLAGQSGSSGTHSGSGTVIRGEARPGNPAGAYINGNSFVTWLATGTCLGGVL